MCKCKTRSDNVEESRTTPLHPNCKRRSSFYSYLYFVIYIYIIIYCTVALSRCARAVRSDEWCKKQESACTPRGPDTKNMGDVLSKVVTGRATYLAKFVYCICISVHWLYIANCLVGSKMIKINQLIAYLGAQSPLYHVTCLWLTNVRYKGPRLQVFFDMRHIPAPHIFSSISMLLVVPSFHSSPRNLMDFLEAEC